MLTILAVAVLVVAAVYGLEIGNSRRDTKVCVAVTCNMESKDTEGTSGVRLPQEQPPSQGP